MAADGGVSVGGEGEHGVDAGSQRHVGGGVHHRHQPRPRPPAGTNKYSDLTRLISSRRRHNFMSTYRGVNVRLP